MRTVLLESKAPGGQLLNTELFEDHRGQESILGRELADIMLRRATRFGTGTGQPAAAEPLCRLP